MLKSALALVATSKPATCCYGDYSLHWQWQPMDEGRKMIWMQWRNSIVDAGVEGLEVDLQELSLQSKLATTMLRNRPMPT